MKTLTERALAQKLRHPLAYRRGLGARSVIRGVFPRLARAEFHSKEDYSWR
jgi:hypothetical protein